MTNDPEFDRNFRTSYELVDLINNYVNYFTNVPYKLEDTEFEGKLFLLTMVSQQMDKELDMAPDPIKNIYGKRFHDILSYTMNGIIEEASGSIQTKLYTYTKSGLPQVYVHMRMEYYKVCLAEFYSGENQIPTGICLGLFQRPMQEIEYNELPSGKYEITGNYPDIEMSIIVDFVNNIASFISEFQSKVEDIIIGCLSSR